MQFHRETKMTVTVIVQSHLFPSLPQENARERGCRRAPTSRAADSLPPARAAASPPRPPSFYKIYCKIIKSW